MKSLIKDLKPHRVLMMAMCYLDAGFFFSLANVFNFMQGRDWLANFITILNFSYVVLVLSYRAYQSQSILGVEQDQPRQHLNDQALKNMADRFKSRQFFNRLLKELENPLSITAYCVLIVACVLLERGFGGHSDAFFPGLAATFFGLGNFIQAHAISEKPLHQRPQIYRALLHPAVWYGLGYTMTGITIGGGGVLFISPAEHLLAFLLTTIGVVETVGSLCLMTLRILKHQSSPFVGVAFGTLIFAGVGAMTQNYLGCATGISACAGELTLALLYFTESLSENHFRSNKLTALDRFFLRPLQWFRFIRINGYR